MTVDELQTAIDNTDTAVIYIGWMSKVFRGQTIKWRVIIGPAPGSSRWRVVGKDIRFRGKGASVGEALDDAFEQVMAMILRLSEAGHWR